MNKKTIASLKRRDFLKASLAGLAAVPGMGRKSLRGGVQKKKSRIALMKTQDREKAVKSALQLLDLPSMNGKKILVKPNFNTADPFPASTHNDTLASLILEIKAQGAASVTVGERSGPPPTHKVMEEKGIFAMAEDIGFEVINFEDLSDEEWVHFSLAGHHWPDGFDLPRPVVEAGGIVSTCCLKTHQYGGVFTMSLKLAVGLTPKKLMRVLHNSPDMRKMIAEINAAYAPQFILMDGLEAFVDGGPSHGKKAAAGIFIAGTDRVAVDAAGLAVLKDLGSNEAIMGNKIFDQEQIQRAVELGLGISSPEQIEFVTADKPSQLYADKLKSILARG